MILSSIKGILFDKDGTLVDFQATWFAIGDLLALQAAGGDRGKADALMAAAGYDFAKSASRPIRCSPPAPMPTSWRCGIRKPLPRNGGR